MIANATIGASDFDLFETVDDPRAAVGIIFRRYEHRGFALSAEEQEMLMHL